MHYWEIKYIGKVFSFVLCHWIYWGNIFVFGAKIKWKITPKDSLNIWPWGEGAKSCRQASTISLHTFLQVDQTVLRGRGYLCFLFIYFMACISHSHKLVSDQATEKDFFTVHITYLYSTHLKTPKSVPNHHHTFLFYFIYFILFIYCLLEKNIFYA